MDSPVGLGRRDHHELPVHEVVLLLETDESSGLSSSEARRRLERFGPNVLPQLRRHGPLLRFLLQLHHPLVWILIAAGVVTAVLGEVVDASVIFGVVVVNAIVGFLQESKAEAALDALVSMVRTEAVVIRDGARMTVQSDELVPGDVVVLDAGAKVPADLRLIDARNLRVDESALTGESAPVDKRELRLPIDTVLADRTNMAWSATLVTAGSGVGIVVATGAGTELGEIHRLVGTAADIATPLTRKISEFSSVLTVVIVGLAIVAFVVGMLRGESAKDMFTAAVALAVGAIPEGLPAAVTITLAIGMARMSQRHAIIRRLPAVETLGSTTLICSDKTGTLTQNQMTVTHIWVDGETFVVTGAGYGSTGDILDPNGSPVLATRASGLWDTLVVGALCNDARIDETEDGPEAVGDPTEAALVVVARKGGVDVDDNPWSRVDVVPFESDRQWMATLDVWPDAESTVAIHLKGGVEAVVALCDRQQGIGGSDHGVDVDGVLGAADMLARQGLRVLACATRTVPVDTATIDGDCVAEGRFTLAGLQAMADPPRPEAARAVAACQKAGIGVKMITGDHAATAFTIAAQLGLADGDTPAVMTGSDLAACSDADLPDVACRTAVFARVAPEQKLRLVEALQARGHIVAMTGDGVNDAPALKQADIGVAMGQIGTEVAKEAADMVLTDDNFATIEAAVEEGRGVFANLTKFIVWTLPTNMAEGLVLLAAIAAGTTLPILPVQILWINMTTAVALGLMLAFEPKEPHVMDQPPRDPTRPLLTAALIGRIISVSALLLVGVWWLFDWALASGASAAEARTVAINVFVAVETAYLFNCRSLTRSMFRIGVLSNPWVTAGVAVQILLQAAITYLPAMNRLFRTAPISPAAWVRIAAVAVVAYAVVGAESWFRNRRHPHGRQYM